MKTNRFLLSAIFGFALAFTFFACSSDDPSPSETQGGESSGDTAKLCGDVEYNANIYRCEYGELIGKCNGTDYRPLYQICNNGRVEDRNPLDPYVPGNEPSSSSLQNQNPNSSSSSSSLTNQSSGSVICKDNSLGKGYDVIRSEYINRAGVLNSVLDQNKLCQANIVKTAVSATETDFISYAGKSITELYKERGKSINAGIDFPFIGGIDTKFSTTKAQTSTSQVYYAQLRAYIYETLDEITDKSNLSKYLTDGFISDLKNKPAAQILTLYGTHVFVSYKNGGWLEANYIYSGTSLKDEVEVKTAIGGHYKSVSGGINNSDITKDIDKTESTEFKYKTYGGEPLGATSFDQLKKEYTDWKNSISKKAQIAGIGEFKNSLVPIWELAKEAGYTAEAAALQKSFNDTAAALGVKFPKGRIFDTRNIPWKGTGTLTAYSIGGDCSECTYVEMEVYALGAGGGGQGGDSTKVLLKSDIGTGGAGGGGAATYARLKLGQLKSVTLDSITIGKGGTGGSSYGNNGEKQSGEHSGYSGTKGGDTKVVYKGARIIASGGLQGGGTDPYTTGGTGGSISNLPTASDYYIKDSGISRSGSSGTAGDWQSQLKSTGGAAASITGYGTISSFPGGAGGIRLVGGTITSPGIGGGGSGGYSIQKGANGGDGSLVIVLKYYKEEGKTTNPSSSGTITNNTPASLLWDLSMGMGLSTGGGWYGYDDQGANSGYSTVLFRDKTDNQYRSANNVMEWDGAASFALDPTGFEYAYAGAGFSWLGNGAAAPSVWGSHTGLCLEYSLSGTGDYYLKIVTNGYTEDNEFKVTIPKQATVAKKLFSLSSFTQGDGWGVIRTLADVKQKSVGMQIQGEAPRKTVENPSGYTTTQTGALILKSINWDSCN
ncbi:MAG: hypothetical protein LBC87_05355 [Fibromonadaceae bacterium]|jgi:hypothetical protein|nr:hypothetical protein [Fibromonadaceae bacterium]